MLHRRRILLILAAAACTAAMGESPRHLTFEDRVRAQEAIERVYQSHRLAPDTPFEQAVPRQLLETKVANYLRQSAVLERVWHTPVTADALDLELRRILGQSRYPERLAEIRAALGQDLFLLKETLVRATLVDRLSRSFYAQDRLIHAKARRQADQLHADLTRGTRRTRDEALRTERWVWDEQDAPGAPSDAAERRSRADLAALRSRLPAGVGMPGPVIEAPDAFVVESLLEERPGGIRVGSWAVPKRTWDDWWSAISPTLDPYGVAAVASEGEPPTVQNDATAATTLAACAGHDTWDDAGLRNVTAPRSGHASIWTGSEMLVWGGSNGQILVSGARYDPLTDTWSPMQSAGAPTGRQLHSTVWTGTEMIIWGGGRSTVELENNGARYNPASNSWTAVATLNAPAKRWLHTAVWTGTKMIVWGGANATTNLNTGGIYDPATNIWAGLSTTSAPSARTGHSAVWTGTYMIVWGGGVNTGARYSPAAGTWSSVQTLGAPTSRTNHAAVWTGTHMLVWGGTNNGTPTSSGALYDPAANSWSPTTLTGAPMPRTQFSHVWSGSRLIVWGGMAPGYINTGGSYDPAGDAWTSISTSNSPSARRDHSAVWAGTQMIVWGGYGVALNLDSGGRYSPATDSWTPTSRGGAPVGRTTHTTVWTGSEMIVWGGDGEPFYTNSGGRFDPLTASWTPTSLVNAPSPRASHSAVWTGSEMILWGGHFWTGNQYDRFSDGARYSPVADLWTALPLADAPVGRSGHSAVWTGTKMIVWGGAATVGTSSVLLDTGGAFDPQLGSWGPISSVGAPSARGSHVAFWTGSRMLVWGGDYGAVPGSGGLYDPATDLWTAVSSAGAPKGTIVGANVWTGSELVTWSGYDGTSYPAAGATYDPASNLWTPISAVDAPVARGGVSSIWTGSEMLVWGGRTHDPIVEFTDGSRYDPVSDRWRPVGESLAAASPRDHHGAVWTGDDMIVWGGSGAGAVFLDDGSFYHIQPLIDQDGDGSPLCDGDCSDTQAAVFPGAPQVCDGLNNDCAAPEWPSLTGTNENDADGDTFSVCQGDCSDASASVWATPGEAQDITFVDDVTFSWSAPQTSGATSLQYDALRAAAATGFSAGGVCTESNDGADTLAVDPSAPSPGEVFYYLVRAENGCPGALGIGPLGDMSNGTPRTGRTCP